VHERDGRSLRLIDQLSSMRLFPLFMHPSDEVFSILNWSCIVYCRPAGLRKDNGNFLHVIFQINLISVFQFSVSFPSFTTPSTISSLSTSWYQSTYFLQPLVLKIWSNPVAHLRSLLYLLPYDTLRSLRLVLSMECSSQSSLN
jgi:hypothetical protein